MDSVINQILFASDYRRVIGEEIHQAAFSLKRELGGKAGWSRSLQRMRKHVIESHGMMVSNLAASDSPSGYHWLCYALVSYLSGEVIVRQVSMLREVSDEGMSVLFVTEDPVGLSAFVVSPMAIEGYASLKGMDSLDPALIALLAAELNLVLFTVYEPDTEGCHEVSVPLSSGSLWGQVRRMNPFLSVFDGFSSSFDSRQSPGGCLALSSKVLARLRVGESVTSSFTGREVAMLNFIVALCNGLLREEGLSEDRRTLFFDTNQSLIPYWVNRLLKEYEKEGGSFHTASLVKMVETLSRNVALSLGDSDSLCIRIEEICAKMYNK